MGSLLRSMLGLLNERQEAELGDAACMSVPR